MARFGIRGARVLGVPVKTLRAIARETGCNLTLAEELWASGIHEARILASIVAEPKRVTLDQMDRWASDLDSWDLCDQCCANLWVRTPFARERALVWSEREEEFVKRAGFVLMVQVAGKDKGAPAELLHRYLARAEREAGAELNQAAEFETATHSRLGSVVTNHGYSDWATQDVTGPVTDLWYRLRREDDDVFIDWSEDGAAWR